MPPSRSYFTYQSRFLGVGLLSFVGFWGCQGDMSNSSEADRARAISDASSDERSPNARILPEPLAESGDPGTSSGDDALSSTSSEPLPRPIPVPWLFATPLSEDEMKRGVAPGLRLNARFIWPQSARTVQNGDRLIDTWPLLTIELLGEMPRREARQRWIFETDVFPFPRLTELRSRADRLGHVVVWPDTRSYRVIPSGALRSLFSDRRADRLPYVETTRKYDGAGERLGQPTRRTLLTTALGTAVLETIEQVDLPSASNLFCHSLLELIRVNASDELCPLGQLPVALEVKWQGGGEIQFEVTAITAVANLNVDGFRAPPILPIFKSGELPPSERMLLSAPVREKVFPLETKSDVLVPDPHFKPSISAEPLAPSATIAPVVVPERIKNEVILINHHDRPLLILMNRVPLMWLNPSERQPLYLRQEGARLGARDFFGEIGLEGSVVVAPRDVPFGQDLVHPGANTSQ